MTQLASFRGWDTPPLGGRHRHAWVTLVMRGDEYVPGAAVTANSLRSVKTRHDIICMVTGDVSEEARAALRGSAEEPLFDNVVEVPYVEHQTRRLRSEKQVALYGDWIDQSFTKWNCLTLTDYDRVVFVDADVVFLVNCDELFDLRPPAASYSNPWASPAVRRGGVPNFYAAAARDLAHGVPVPEAQIEKALRNGGFVGWGAMVLLEPDAGAHADFLTFLDAAGAEFGAEFTAISGADELSIAAFYASRGWTHIHPRYLAIPWKKDWVKRDIRAVHYHGKKPWAMKPDEWPDLADWWKHAKHLTESYPDLRKWFPT